MANRKRYFVVYCSAMGFRCDRDTGKSFQFESEADHYAMHLRRAGYMAWVESELNRPRDEYGM